MTSLSDLFRIALASGLAGVLVGSGVSAQTGAGAGATPQATRPGAGAMMAGQMPMMQERQASQQRLDELVAAMNAARGAERLDAIAAVVSELAARQKQMPGGTMCGGMMPQRPNGSEAVTPETGAADDSHHQFER
jgi:hypothetical protein